MSKIISFPNIGDYYIPIYYLLKNTSKTKIIIPPKITKKTIELGSMNSPDYVCVPFKYNLGNFIESLDLGANVILQAGGGCRYGYYAELQEQILKDLNYDFEFINFIKNNHVSINNIYKFTKYINPKLNKIKFYYYLLNTVLMIIIMDKLGKYPRENMGFEIEKNSFEHTEQRLHKELQEKINIYRLIKIYHKYKKEFKNIPLKKNKDRIKIGIVGELFSIMEPYSSNHIEKKLAKLGIEVHRYTTITYLMFIKKYKLKYYLRKGRKYLKYHLGADGTESVVLSYILAKKHYDGIVHIKSFGCTPELNAMPILERISNDYNIPIVYFSFDSQDSEVGINTRIEAFYDMLVQKKKINKK